jgi:hypothetical protein
MLMPDDPDNLVLALLRRLDTKIDRVAADVRNHTSLLNVLRQDVVMVRAAINDMARTSFTAGEAEALHEELNRLQEEFAKLAARVEIIEARDRH